MYTMHFWHNYVICTSLSIHHRWWLRCWRSKGEAKLMQCSVGGKFAVATRWGVAHNPVHQLECQLLIGQSPGPLLPRLEDQGISHRGPSPWTPETPWCRALLGPSPQWDNRGRRGLMFHLHTRHFLLLIINHYLFEIIIYIHVSGGIIEEPIDNNRMAVMWSSWSLS